MSGEDPLASFLGAQLLLLLAVVGRVTCDVTDALAVADTAAGRLLAVQRFRDGCEQIAAVVVDVELETRLARYVEDG